MKGKLNDSWGKGGMVTPLVDVVFNLMITMFIFLMIYMAVVVPKPERKLRPLEFVGATLPPAAPYVEYQSAIPVGYGSGKFSFVGAPVLLTNQGTLQLNSRDGSLRGIFLAVAATNIPASTNVTIPVVVVDNEHRALVPPEMAVPWTTNGSNLHVVFHMEWPQDARKQFEELPHGEMPKTAALGRRVVCYYAIRNEFKLRLKPVSIPFDPAEEPLRLTGARQAKGVVGFPLEISLAPIGGIEPYEIATNGVPGWLKLDARRATLAGVPSTPGRIEMTVSVKDAQTPTNDWASATALKDAPGHPLVTATLALEVEEYRPLEAHLFLPLFGRVDDPFQGAVIFKGGAGKKRFSPVQLPAGLIVDIDSGALSGIPTVTNRNVIEIRIVDDSTNVLVRSTARQWRGIIERQPAPSIIGGSPSP